MNRPRRTLLTLAVLFAGAAPATASAAERKPIKDCGDVFTMDKDFFFLGAVTAQGGSCKNARAIARIVTRSRRCKRIGSCRVRTYICLLGMVGKEYTLVACSNDPPTAFIRFEFGS